MAERLELIDDDEEFPLHVSDSTIHLHRLEGHLETRIIKKHTKRGVTNWTAAAFDMIAAAVTRWENVNKGGQPIEWDRTLATRVPPDTREQILEAIGANVPGTSAYDQKADESKNLPSTSDSST